MIAARLARLSLRFPLPVLAALLIVTTIAAIGSQRLRSQSYLDGHLPQGDARLSDYRDLGASFGSDRISVFAISCVASDRCSTVFEPQVLSLIRALDSACADLSAVERVLSIASAPVLVSDGATLEARVLSARIDRVEAAEFGRIVLDDPLTRGSLVSADGQTAAVVVQFDLAAPDTEVNRSSLAMLHRLEEIAMQAGFTLHASGVVLLAASADEYVRADLALLTPAMVILLAALLLWIFRNGWAVAIALGAVLIPALWTFGLMGWFERPITPVSSTMPILILVVGITDAVHFLVRARDLHSSRTSMHELVLEVAREVGPPTTVTAITSSLGFLSFLAGPLPSLRDFGLFAAIGVMGAWLLTFTLVPVLLSRLALQPSLRPLPLFDLSDRLLAAIRDISWRRAGLTLAVTSALMFVSIIGVFAVKPETNGWKLRGEGDRFVRSEEFLRTHLRSTESLEVVYRIPLGLDVSDLEVLDSLERIESRLLELSDGKAVLSVLSVLRLANREIAEGGLDLPGDPDLAAQLLLVAELADSQAMGRILSADHKQARLVAPYLTRSSDSIRRDVTGLEVSLRDALPADSDWTVTGSSVLLAHLSDLVLENQVASFSSAFLTIFVVIFLFVRSFGLGAVGMVPNVVPVAVVLGFMGFADINLDVGTAMIASILLGVSVDDTIYFLIHYKRARSGGAQPADAVAYTFAIAGKPAIFCAAVLALGFFVLAFSSFQSLSIFGLLSGFAVLLAAATELFVLPAVLRISVGSKA